MDEVHYSERHRLFPADGPAARAEPVAPPASDPCRQVMAAIGVPPGYEAVTARLVRDRTYRVNVFVVRDGRRTISDSHYLLMDGPRIVASNPPLARKYGNGTPLA